MVWPDFTAGPVPAIRVVDLSSVTGSVPPAVTVGLVCSAGSASAGSVAPGAAVSDGAAEACASAAPLGSLLSMPHQTRPTTTATARTGRRAASRAA
jgi:hypothetical protein